MKGMPLPFDFEGKGVFGDTSNLLDLIHNNKWKYSEPTSVLDNITSPSPPTSTSTLSSSFGGAGSGGGSGFTDTAGVAAVSGNPSQNVGVESGCGSLEQQQQQQQLHPVPPYLEIGGGVGGGAAEKCGLGLEDWEGVLSDSPSQDQSMLRWIMGDVEDPTMGMNKVLQMGGSSVSADFDFNGGFGAVDQGFGFDQVGQFASSAEKIGFAPNLQNPNPNPNPMFSALSNNLAPVLLNPPFECSDVKPQVFNFNPQVVVNQQNPGLFLPLSYTHQDQHHFLVPPQPKRHNPGNIEPNPGAKGPFLDSGQQVFVGMPQPPIQGLSHHQLQLLPPYLQPRPTTMAPKPKIIGEEYQQAIIDQLYKATELVQSGNSQFAQGILARLNHQLSPIGKPFHRAAFYCKEALQLLLPAGNNMNSSTMPNSPFNLIFKIGAYKSFSEISPLVQFANFTCNQALLETLDGFDRIHVIDFDIGYGGQWASLMQELALRSGGAPSLKITAFASPSTHDQLELGLTQENLNHFASEINMPFEFEIVSFDGLNSGSWSFPLRVSESDAIAVNLPVGSFFNYQIPLPSVLRFVKQLSPKIVVSIDRGCDRNDLPFPNHVIHALQFYSNLLESLDAMNVNLDVLQKIERFLLQPGIEKIVMGRYRSPEKTQHWRSHFLSSGFAPLGFSNFTESQAECVVKRTPVRGFHVEKRQSSLVLCWQRRELISASAWRC